MRTLTPLALLLGTALLLAACDSAEDPAPAEDSAPVIPLAVGAEWVLQHTSSVRFSRFEPTPDTVSVDDGRFITLTVARDTLISGEQWFRIEPSRPFGNPTLCYLGAAWYANREDGLYQLIPGSAPELLLASDAEPGEPFIDTPEAAVALLHSAAAYELPGLGVVEARSFERTQRRFEATSGGEGPVVPHLRSVDYLSADVGPVALSVPYLSTGEEEGMWRPAVITRYELVSYELP